MKRHISVIATFLLTVSAAPVLSQQKTTQKAATGDFSKAKSELQTDYYVLYRIVDKLSRANNIAQGSWRVKISDQYALNGFAEQANLIVVPRTALNQLSGDADALACMVGREMSHHVRKHNAIGPAEQAALKKQIKEEALRAAEANQSSKRGWGTGLGIVGGILGVNTRGVQGAINANTDRATAKVIKEKERELNKRIAETSARIEKEADEDAFVYLARASRDPKGCIRYLDFISREPQSEPDPSNPQIPGRIQAYREFIEGDTSKSKFVAEGNANLARNSKPLTYAVTDNGNSLKIDSTRGSTVKQIENF